MSHNIALCDDTYQPIFSSGRKARRNYVIIVARFSEAFGANEQEELAKY